MDLLWRWRILDAAPPPSLRRYFENRYRRHHHIPFLPV
ncbi:hypothetical protein X997_5514 [Burkholderia pseudomallei A79C]|nr:hypothetical protein X997_5514 [Burkholderia pseudomallei A79C]